MLIITEGKLGEGMMLKPTISGPEQKEAATVPAVLSVKAHFKTPVFCESCGYPCAALNQQDGE